MRVVVLVLTLVCVFFLMNNVYDSGLLANITKDVTAKKISQIGYLLSFINIIGGIWVFVAHKGALIIYMSTSVLGLVYGIKYDCSYLIIAGLTSVIITLILLLERWKLYKASERKDLLG